MNSLQNSWTSFRVHERMNFHEKTLVNFDEHSWTFMNIHELFMNYTS